MEARAMGRIKPKSISERKSELRFCRRAAILYHPVYRYPDRSERHDPPTQNRAARRPSACPTPSAPHASEDGAAGTRRLG